MDGYSELESTLTGDGETPGVLDLNDALYQGSLFEGAVSRRLTEGVRSKQRKDAKMKKILSILLALALMLGATFALAEGNVTIAVQGMNDFNDYIQSMVVYGDRLLLSSWDRL